MTTVSDIVNQLTLGMSVDDIRALVNTWDMSVGGDTLILYSGGVGEIDSQTSLREYGAKELAEALSEASDTGSGKTISTIADTGIQALFDDADFRNALDNAIANDTTGIYSGRTRDQVLFGLDSSDARIGDGFWDDASRNLVNQHDGDFRLIMPDAPDGSVAVMTEIPALLEKNIVSGQKVNGIDLQDWRAKYDSEKAVAIVAGMTEPEADAFVRSEINDLISKTSNADLADMNVGRDGTGQLYVDTSGHLGNVLGLDPEGLPQGVEPTRVSSLPDMQMTPSDLALVGKYSDLINKAGIVGDVLGIVVAIAQATEAYDNGDANGAAEIIAGYVGNITGGFAAGTVSATAVAALLAIPGVNVGVVAGMAIAGAAGFLGGYLGGTAGEQFFRELYNDVSGLGAVPFIAGILDDYGWAFENPGPLAGGFLPWLGGLLPGWVTGAAGMFHDGEAAVSPIVLDIDMSGTIDLAALNGAGSVYWDIDGDGFAEASGWIAGGEAANDNVEYPECCPVRRVA